MKCNHDWEKMEAPRLTYVEANGEHVYSARCKCSLCGKERVKTFKSSTANGRIEFGARPLR